MQKHIFKTFLDEKFKESNEINMIGISLFFGSPGSGKTYLLNELFKKYNGKILYIGRGFEKTIYFQNFQNSKINKERIFLSSNFNEKIDFYKLEEDINKLIKEDYFIIFDEVFWQKEEEYYKMIERIIIQNKLNTNMIIVLQHIINNENFKYERIAKNLNQIVMFKNNIINFTNNIGEYKIYKKENSTTLTKKDIENFQKN